MNKPAILEIVRQDVRLRKVGKEWIGLCPFHSEKSPSFSVSEEKGLFHCFGCGESGDVFDFIMKLDSLTFAGAKAALGVDNRRPRRSDALLSEARKLAAWANEMTERAMSLLREIGQRGIRAREAQLNEEVEALSREWTILEALAEDLQDKNYVLELYRQREGIEHLLAPAVIEPWPEWPELTSEYRKFVADLPKPPSNEARAHG